MATKKAEGAEEPKKKDTLVKIAEAIGEAAGHISVKKDQLTEKASHAVDAIKEGVHNLVEKEKKMVKKVVDAEKKVVRKITGKSAKKSAPKKPAKPNTDMLHKALHKNSGTTVKAVGSKKAVSATKKAAVKK